MGILKKLVPLVRPYKGKIATSITFHVLSAFFTVVSIPLIYPFFQILFEKETQNFEKPEGFDLEGHLQYFFNDLIITYDKQYALLMVCIAIVVVFFFKNLTRYLATYTMIPVRTGIVSDLRNNLFSKFLQLPLSFFSNEKKGNLITKLSSDIQEIEVSIIQVIEATFKAPFILIGCLTYMIVTSPRLSIFVAILLVFVVLIIGGISRRLRKESSEVQIKMSEIISQAEETIGGIKVIKAYQNESFVLNSFKKLNVEWKNLLTRILRRRDLSSPFSEFMGVTVVAILLYYGSSLVFQDRLQASSFFAFIFAFYQIIEPAKSLAGAYYHVQKGMASVDRLNEIHEIQNPLLKNCASIEFNGVQDKVVFKNVDFAYQDEDGQVLKNLNFELPKNSMTAIVGSSGAGKTTLVDLLARFYDPTNGEIVVDGVVLNDFDIHSLRKNIGLVSQEVILFHDSIENNIIFSDEKVSKDRIVEAAKLAHAHEFIQSMPNGYQTIIGDRGVKLSGGQRQRLALARAILSDPMLIILDEATSALDSSSELLVQDALENFLKNKTSVVIAHRLSTIKNADNILVMKEGKIIEQGKHEYLLNKNGEYAEFVRLQMSQKASF